MRQNLAVVRSGANSLHPAWLEGGSGRNWDLLLCPFQEGPGAGDDVGKVAIFPGQKWTGLHAYLTKNERWRDYRYIWLPDDDLMATASDIDRFFDFAAALDATLCAPALHEDSYYSHVITMRNRSFHARATTFVEIMAPCFRRDVLERLLPTFGDDAGGYGWGLDYAWPRLLDYAGVYIIDSAAVRHTRPVGQMRDDAMLRRLKAELQDALRRYGAPAVQRTLHARTETGEIIPADANKFLWQYIRGYEYLLDREPGLLRYLFHHQMDPVFPPERIDAAGRLRAFAARALRYLMRRIGPEEFRMP